MAVVVMLVIFIIENNVRNVKTDIKNDENLIIKCVPVQYKAREVNILQITVSLGSLPLKLVSRPSLTKISTCIHDNSL